MIGQEKQTGCVLQNRRVTLKANEENRKKGFRAGWLEKKKVERKQLKSNEKIVNWLDEEPVVPELVIYGGRNGENMVREPFDREFKCSSCMNLY